MANTYRNYRRGVILHRKLKHSYKKTPKTPLRKKGLNDLEETLPRNNKTEHKLPTGENLKPSSPYKK